MHSVVRSLCVSDPQCMRSEGSVVCWLFALACDACAHMPRARQSFQYSQLPVPTTVPILGAVVDDIVRDFELE